MASKSVVPTGIERTFDVDQLIVSKTDLKGRITYINQLFEIISGFERRELIGQPHNIIRHPDMPRCVFALAWEHLKQGEEIFAYVKNMCKSGDHYWVLAHMVPSFSIDGKNIGYHSSRRAPKKENVAIIENLYMHLLEIEEKGNRKEGILKARQYLDGFLSEKSAKYDEFIFSLTKT